MNIEKIRAGLWGENGHQIHHQLQNYPQIELAAIGAFKPENAEKIKDRFPQAVFCQTLEEMIAIEGLEWISFCSPKRSEQGEQVVRALEAGIHAYAEKPCATSLPGLDRIMAAAQNNRVTFHEMAGTVFANPYWAMRQTVQAGHIGDTVQVLAQKSYPYHLGRPLCEDSDGGLVAQNGVHAMRFVEHITGLRAESIDALQTSLGETRENSDLQMASSLMGRLSNGGLYTVIANYLNPPGFGSWGNEMVRIFGTRGMVEAVDGGQKTRLIIKETDHGGLDLSVTPPDWLKLVLDDVRGENRFPFDLETELHPTRLVLQAAAKAARAGKK